MTLYQRAGGEAGLRHVLADFYDRVFADPMIGFLFRGRDKALLIQREVQFTARLLGGDLPYEGRPMREAHAALPLFRGHFARRHQILIETLEDHRVPAEVRDAWLEHARNLEAAVLGPARHDPDCGVPPRTS